MPASAPHPGLAGLADEQLLRRALTFAVWAAAVAGAALGAAALTDDPPLPTAVRPAPVPATGTLEVGDRIPMSFGNASVGSVVRLTGGNVATTMRPRAGERAFQVQLTVINLRRRPLTFAPDQLSLEPASQVRKMQVATGAAEGGRIGARRPHRFSIRFVAPATGALPALLVRDPGTGRRRAVALGGAADVDTFDLGAMHRSSGHTATGGRHR